MSTVYISGPMTGYPDWNFPAFNAAADELRRRGHAVVNPADGGAVDPGKTWADYIRKDIRDLLDCDAIYMLPGWEASRGARLEHRIATELDYPVLAGSAYS